jgi:hypothetical protein
MGLTKFNDNIEMPQQNFVARNKQTNKKKKKKTLK